MRNEIIKLGGEFLFNEKVTDFEFENSKVTAVINLRSYEYMIGPPEMDDYIDGNGSDDITIANSDGTGYINTASEHSLNVPIFFNIGYNSSTGTFYLGNSTNGSTLKFPFASVQESSNYDD